MIKDLVVNLALAAERDPAAEFALSVANTFAAHATGIAFQYDPIMPTALIDDVPPDVIDTQRAENERAANAATRRFDDATRIAAVRSETRIIQSTMAGVATPPLDAMTRSSERSDFACWHPDGKHLVFVGERNGWLDLYMVEAPA